MASDIFGRQPVSTITSAKAENLGLTLSGQIDTLWFVQQANWSYAQRVTRLFDLASPDRMLYLAARPEGALNLVHAVTDAEKAVNVFEQLGDVCKAENNTITLSLPKGKCDTGTSAGLGFKFNNCVLVSCGLSQSVADYVISDSIAIMFSHIST